MNEGGRGFDLELRLVRFSGSVIDIVEGLPESKVGNHIAGQLLVLPGEAVENAMGECNELTAIFVASIATARHNMKKERGEY